MIRTFLILLLFAIPIQAQDSSKVRYGSNITGIEYTEDPKIVKLQGQINFWKLRYYEEHEKFQNYIKQEKAFLLEIEQHTTEFVNHPLIKSNVDSVLASFLPKGTEINDHFMKRMLR